MLVIAVMFDLLGIFIGLIPLIGLIFVMLIPISAAVIFGVWFAIKRVSYFSGKKAGLKILSMMGGVAVEFVPLLNMIMPGITLGVFGVIISSRIEDAAEEAKEATQKPARAVSPRFGPRKITHPETRTVEEYA